MGQQESKSAPGDPFANVKIAWAAPDVDEGLQKQATQANGSGKHKSPAQLKLGLSYPHLQLAQLVVH